jgi:hypothetical protein
MDTPSAGAQGRYQMLGFRGGGKPASQAGLSGPPKKYFPPVSHSGASGFGRFVDEQTGMRRRFALAEKEAAPIVRLLSPQSLLRREK